MENTDYTLPQPQEQDDTLAPSAPVLLLTKSLMAQMPSSGHLGAAAFFILLAIVAIDALLTLTSLTTWFDTMPGGFYLLEGDTLSRLVSYLIPIVGIYFMGRASWEGLRAWRLLKQSNNDDNALLEGTDRLTQMFKWFVYWGIFYGAMWAWNTAHSILIAPS